MAPAAPPHPPPYPHPTPPQLCEALRAVQVQVPVRRHTSRPLDIQRAGSCPPACNTSSLTGGGAGGSPAHSVFSRENALRRACIWTIQQWWFDAFIILLIAANCLLLAQFDPTQVRSWSVMRWRRTNGTTTKRARHLAHTYTSLVRMRAAARGQQR